MTFSAVVPTKSRVTKLEGSCVDIIKELLCYVALRLADPLLTAYVALGVLDLSKDLIDLFKILHTELVVQSIAG